MHLSNVDYINKYLSWCVRHLGDFAQVSHCCNQVIKYNDANYEDVSSAAEFAEDLMQSLLLRRKETSLQVRIKLHLNNNTNITLQ